MSNATTATTAAKPRRVIFTSSFLITWDEAPDRVLRQARRDRQEKELFAKAQLWMNHENTTSWDIIIRPGYITFEDGPDKNDVATGSYIFHSELWLVENNFIAEPPRFLPMRDDQFETTYTEYTGVSPDA
jgi:hypothetical protein